MLELEAALELAGTLELAGALELVTGDVSLPPLPPPQAPRDKAMINAQHARRDDPLVNFIGNLQFFIAIICTTVSNLMILLNSLL